MKGKKFTAAEKHFLEKAVKRRQEARYSNELADKILKENDLLLKENNQLKIENAEIKVKYEKLLELSKLSENDIKTVLQRDKLLSDFTGLMRLSKYL